MELRHIEQVVDVHLESFRGFFLSFLGPRFLRLLYLGICRDEMSIKLVALSDEGDIVGFVAGSQDPARFFARLLRRDWWRFAMASLSGIIRKPGIIPRIARALFHPSSSPAGVHIALLMSIGVAPSAQTRGIGRELVAAFLGEAADRGAKEVRLTTDRDDNDSVRNFYRRVCFTEVSEYRTPEGRWLVEYLRKLDGRPPIPSAHVNNDGQA